MIDAKQAVEMYEGEKDSVEYLAKKLSTVLLNEVIEPALIDSIQAGYREAHIRKSLLELSDIFAKVGASLADPDIYFVINSAANRATKRMEELGYASRSMVEIRKLEGDDEFTLEGVVVLPE